MAPTFSKMAVPAIRSPLGHEPVTAQDVVQTQILIQGNTQPWAGRDVAQAASDTQRFAPLPPPHNLQHSLLRGVVDPYLIMARDRARARANAAAAMDINEATGSLPLNSGSPSSQQASTERSRKRKAPEVERGDLVPRLRKKTKAEPASSTLEIEPIPRPFTPASADDLLLFVVELLCSAHDAVPSGGVLPGDLPGIPANENVAATGAIHGSTGNPDVYESQMITIQTSLDQSLLPAAASSASPSMPSQPTLRPTPGWDLPAHVNPSINPQDLLARIPSVSPPSSSQQSSPTASSVIPATKPETRWQDIALDFKEGSRAEVGANQMFDFSAAAGLDSEPLPDNGDAAFDWGAWWAAFTAPVVFPTSHSSDEPSEFVLEASSNIPGSLGMPSEVDTCEGSTEDYAFFAATPMSSTSQTC